MKTSLYSLYIEASPTNQYKFNNLWNFATTTRYDYTVFHYNTSGSLAVGGEKRVLFLEMLERVDAHIISWVSVSIWLYMYNWWEPSLCLQKLYGDMDEPDGVYGVASIRQAQPTVMEEILAHESLGNVNPVYLAI